MNRTLQNLIYYLRLLLQEPWKKEADPATSIIVTKLPGLPSSFIYVVLAVGQDPGRTEVLNKLCLFSLVLRMTMISGHLRVVLFFGIRSSSSIPALHGVLPW